MCQLVNELIWIIAGYWSRRSFTLFRARALIIYLSFHIGVNTIIRTIVLNKLVLSLIWRYGIELSARWATFTQLRLRFNAKIRNYDRDIINHSLLILPPFSRFLG